MRVRKRIIQGTAFFLTLVLSALIAISSVAFADDFYTDEYGNYVEWWNFRNTDTNNAVTARPTPTNDKEAWGKWAVKFGSGWAAAPTPPIIVNNKLYIGVANQVIELDKETGEALRYSEKMPGNVGYAMQSPIYADGKIFVAITNGRVAAINIEDMSLAWTTDNSEIIRGQTLSPIGYVKIDDTGYIYTGTWTKDGGDLICTSTDDLNVTVDEEGNKIKSLIWHFNPQVVDAENLAANDSVALGYYWTGAYITDKYLAIGADNGSTLGDYVNDTAFYTLDPLTGEIIDVIYGIKGQVRSTAVFVDGYLYFSTKGAKIYKVSVDEEGHLGEPSYIDMGEFGASSATATPVVYGGKIYLGVQGKGGEFNADGGHGFIVARDDEVLSQESFVYNIPVPGYPQAGALLSDYHVDEDFDGDGAADGRVYLFFTYNAPPGGIFYTYDTPGQTEPTKLTVEESKIFVPASNKQQYCISSIVVDEDGILYYKNDSCYLFAVESNPAALLNLEVLNEEGQSFPLNQEFHTKTAEYKATVASEVTDVSIRLTLEEGVTATVNGTSYPGKDLQVELPDEVNEIVIVTNKNGKSRRYELTISKASVNSDLSALGSAIRNMVPSASNNNTRPMEPDLNTDITEYSFNWITSSTAPIDPATQTMMNIFLKTESDKATVKVYPGENVDPQNVQADGSIIQYPVNGSSIYAYRCPVYSANVKKDSTVRIVVTAEDGVTTKEYLITFNRRVYVSDVTLDTDSAELQPGETLTLIADVQPEIATSKELTWSSSKENVATVDKNGTVTAVGKGRTIITASSEDGPYAECVITVPTDPAEPLSGLNYDPDDPEMIRYYQNGEVDTAFSGFAQMDYDLDDVWYYVEKGFVTGECNDIVSGMIDGEDGWYLVKDSVFSPETTVAKNSYGWWKIENGKVDFQFNGFADNEYGTWYLKDGNVDFNYTGFVSGTAQGDPGWWYVEKGKVAFNKTDILSGKANTEADKNGVSGWWYVLDGKVFSGDTVAKNANGWWAIRGGKVDFNYTGFAKNNYGWWYAEKGQVTFKKNDIIKGKANTDVNADGVDGWWYVKGSQIIKTTTVDKNAYGWWFIKDGQVDFTYNGVESNANGWWCIHKGQVDFNYTGFEKNDYGWWYAEKGQVTFKKNDIISGKANTDANADGEDGWWLVKGSQVKNETTVAQNSYGWWYVYNGKVDFTYKGFADNDYGTWYIENGKVDFSFNGSYNDRRVINGKAQ